MPMIQGFTKEELFAQNFTRRYPDRAGAAAFLLGGIGTGNISLGSRGDFRDWEIFNKPAKGNKVPYSFFAIRIQRSGEPPLARILEARLHGPHTQSKGYHPGTVAGLPHLDSSIMWAEYPFVQVDFRDRDLPLDIGLAAFTPFIPLNADDSGIPGAVIRYTIRNNSGTPLSVSIAGSLTNAVGFSGFNEFGNFELATENRNTYRETGTCRGIFYDSPAIDSRHLCAGSMALMTTEKDISHKASWLQGGWFDGIQDFWDDFREDGRLEEQSRFNAPGNRLNEWNLNVGSICIRKELQPGDRHVFEFVLSWYFPNRPKAWKARDASCDCGTTKNYYAGLFADAWEAGRYLLENLERLEKHSRDFRRALFSSTLPWHVLEAVANNITVIRSPTCFRIQDGTFVAWEGCHDAEGCCAGSCTHVWSYAQTLAFLFPALAQSMRIVEFEIETDEDGSMAFRTQRVFGLSKWDVQPAIDGQMGSIIRVYRDWKFSANNDLLKKLWPKISKALDFAFVYWDTDGDFIPDGEQHNTYDIEFFGPNSMTASMFFTALKAGAEMASFLGDAEHEAKYRKALLEGSRRMDEMLWNGEYYIQKLEDVNQYRYQYGSGCLSDQLLGQYHAHVSGLGYILPQENVRSALQSIFKYNFRTDFLNHTNVERTFVLNEEKGLVLCSWPRGGRPKLPFVYADEVWTGIEYQVAANMIYEGLLEEGLCLVKAVRDRQDGYNRNPWNEVECGHHYARSLSSWALLLALSGFQYDMHRKVVSFSPRINRDRFSVFWSTSTMWGVYSQTLDPKTNEPAWEVEVLYGSLGDIKVNAS